MKLLEATYVKNLGSLFLGTVVAQGVPLVCMVFLARLYTPEDFGTWAICLSLASTLSIIATGRLELAIVLPESDREGDALFLSVLMVATLFSLGLFLFVPVLPESILSYLDQSGVQGDIWLIPLGVFVIAVYQAVNYRLIRAAKFQRLAINRVINSTSGTLLQMLLAFYTVVKSFGLFLGQIIGYAVAVVVYLFQEKRQLANVDVDLKTMANQCFRYRRFPLIDVPAALMNTLAANLPILFIGMQFGAVQLGIYAFAIRVFGTPMAMVSGAFLDIFKKEASNEYAERGNCPKSYLKTFLLLSVVGILPSVVVYYAGTYIFEFVFGEEWHDAGSIASALAVMIYARFVSSPLSYMVYIAGKQIFDFVWQACLLLVTGYFLLESVEGGFDVLLYGIVWSHSALYLIYILVSGFLAFKRP